VRLGAWLRESRADVDLQQAISADVGEWIRRGRRADDDLLYRGTVLDEARVWARRNPASVEELTFIEASAKAEAKRKAEQARIARQVQNFRRAAVTFALVFLLAVVAAVYAGIQTQDARQKQDDAETLMDEARSQATHFALVQNRASTLVAGGAIMPVSESTQSPTDFYATLTQIDELNRWTPTSAEITTETWFMGAEGTLDLQVVTSEMVYVPAGCFWMGSVFKPEEQPVHEVCFTRGFWIDRFEVTNAQYAECVKSGYCKWYWEAGPDTYIASLPVVDVNWDQAQSFCEWRGARLPTESEWEYAARGPDSLAYPWGNSFEARYVVSTGVMSYQYGVLDDEGEVEGVHLGEVGPEQRAEGASWVGAYDMSGNAQEWVDGCYGEAYPSEQQIDPDRSAPDCGGGVVRGGSYKSDQVSLRAASRSLVLKTLYSKDLGFRCSRSE
jgi:formylglycine-generating enzyme required for sulfatase activity